MEAVAREIEQFCSFEDDLPRSGGLWPEYAATMLLYVHQCKNDMAVGSLWTFFRPAPIPFHRLDHLLFIMDALIDQAEQTMPWMERRHIKGQEKSHSNRRKNDSQRTASQIQKSLSFRPSLLATVSVRVDTRQHTAMQGALCAEDNRTVCFLSGLELMYLLLEITDHQFTLQPMESKSV